MNSTVHSVVPVPLHSALRLAAGSILADQPRKTERALLSHQLVRVRTVAPQTNTSRSSINKHAHLASTSEAKASSVPTLGASRLPRFIALRAFCFGEEMVVRA
ncbi:hypothetical protein PR202_ga15593 [Eleusine coracana subsp. coracana]|uniref:Uncharacterized protein n=1 Tax=Eleusine coracana subsp. coracana TaxID=191504 RepID=A0AAV5CJU7_ELECO|nr:hypothetical protein PR202_ga15593 [Eleusine coracana subsp. coracana]